MKNKIEEVREEVEEAKKKINTEEIAVKAFQTHYAFTKFIIKVLLLIILCLLAVIAYDAYEDANTGYLETTEETTTEQSGVYNFYDSEGNLVSSDLSLDEMKELVDLNGGVE